jgi:hypothetical protein
MANNFCQEFSRAALHKPGFFVISAFFGSAFRMVLGLSQRDASPSYALTRSAQNRENFTHAKLAPRALGDAQ